MRLDIEAELGFVVGVGSALGDRIRWTTSPSTSSASCCVNDWSARDIQAWEYVPLGPFLGKSFATSISPWVVPLLALEAARVATPAQDPHAAALPRDEAAAVGPGRRPRGRVERRGRQPAAVRARCTGRRPRCSRTLTVNGASLRTGDLFASGTISGPEKDQRGAFIELTWGGAEPVTVGGAKRTFLEDGDEVVITATAPGAAGGAGSASARCAAGSPRPADFLPANRCRSVTFGTQPIPRSERVGVGHAAPSVSASRRGPNAKSAARAADDAGGIEEPGHRHRSS